MPITITKIMDEWKELKHAPDRLIVRISDTKLDKMMELCRDEDIPHGESAAAARKRRDDYKKLLIADIKTMYGEFDKGLSGKLKKIAAGNAGDNREKIRDLDAQRVVKSYEQKVLAKKNFRPPPGSTKTPLAEDVVYLYMKQITKMKTFFLQELHQDSIAG